MPAVRHYLAADEGAALVGYAGLLLGPDAAEVQTLAVAPHAQRRGVGRLLVRELIAEAARRGAPEMLLEVRADDPGARRLYASEGFERVGVRRGYYRRGTVDALVLRRRRPASELALDGAG